MRVKNKAASIFFDESAREAPPARHQPSPPPSPSPSPSLSPPPPPPPPLQSRVQAATSSASHPLRRRPLPAAGASSSRRAPSSSPSSAPPGVACRRRRSSSPSSPPEGSRRRLTISTGVASRPSAPSSPPEGSRHRLTISTAPPGVGARRRLTFSAAPSSPPPEGNRDFLKMQKLVGDEVRGKGKGRLVESPPAPARHSSAPSCSPLPMVKPSLLLLTDEEESKRKLELQHFFKNTIGMRFVCSGLCQFDKVQKIELKYIRQLLKELNSEEEVAIENGLIVDLIDYVRTTIWS